ncbi:MAG TPA: dienelactone hydrolase family protein, partial [Agriterribacter sp.]|nr:dienelactone hydrolase family protein [Agriterribacter sp.]
MKANVHSNLAGFYESLPVDYASNPTKKYPLLIFLHGVGELGNGTTQLPLVLKNAVPKLLNAGTFPASFTVGGEKFSFIVIAPQFKASSGMTEATGAMIDYCKQHYRVDESRIYVTGLSLGGKISWFFASGSKVGADMVAALVPVCSGASESASRIANVTGSRLPMWFLNNSGDPYISATGAQSLVNSINAVMSAPKAKITIFQQNGHDAWTKAYDPNFRENGLNVYEWMLSYKRGTPVQSAPPPASVTLEANAGSNQTITLPASSVTVDGSVKSTYPSGSTFLWVKGEGPSGGTIVSPTSLKTSITGLSTEGDYRFQLRITDKNGNLSTSSMHVIVNAAPASAG